ncbi:hypothetical protein EGY31_01015 [Burkholderia multivorans]|nr:hypothetical protein EGY31_01015 [Burkholderia multivorans]VWC22259.1 hypothetical protein BUB20358_05896 [Burkholderia ubonensis]
MRLGRLEIWFAGLRFRHFWRNKPRKFSDLRGFSLSGLLYERTVMCLVGWLRVRQCPRDQRGGIEIGIQEKF